MQEKVRKVKSLKQPKLIAGYASRSIALDALLAVERESVFANIALAASFKKQELSERDRAFVTALVHGVMRHRLELDEEIDAASQRPGAKIDTVVRNILRIGAFQLSFMPNIPQQAVLNTATELAKVRGHVGLGKFTNGLLRNLARRAAAAATPETADAAPIEAAITKTHKNKLNKLKKRANEEKDLKLEKNEKSLADRYSMPDWLVDRWLKNYGEEETQKLLQFAQRPPLLSIRTCELSITPEGLQEILERQGLAVKRSSLVESCLLIERGRIPETVSSVSRSGTDTSETAGTTIPGAGTEVTAVKADAGVHHSVKSRKSASSFRGSPEKLTGYKEGMFSIQDESAAFVSIIVDPKSTDFVIDLCAAPGGKTLHMAELMENKGRVVAVDQSASRLLPLKESRTRLGLKNLEIVAHDGRTFKSATLADKILIDAPCTGTGVINRRADLRFKRKPEDLASLIELQRELLTNAARCVKPGGSLVYSTCSIEPEENFGNAQWFLETFEQFEPEDISKYLPPSILAECAPTWEGPACKSKMEESFIYSVQLLPSRHNVSGFFVAKFRKKPENNV
jgi:16S rRNA (cytosine967-C5)-methyltransferase